MSQRQAACLLANAFFCTLSNSTVISDRAGAEKTRRKDHYYMINFARMFAAPTSPNRQRAKAAKLACVVHYFDRVTAGDREFDGVITYRRRVLTTFPDWSTSDVHLGRLHVTCSGRIGRDSAGMVLVDFANRCIGGGILSDGCAQEEIRFAVCPELIVARILADPMENNECIVVIGCESFNESTRTGYGATFRWVGDHRDATPIDPWGRRCTEVVAIDATPFRFRTQNQFCWSSIARETNKAYCGFYVEQPMTASQQPPAVATGIWGCGAFRGDCRLKTVIQLLAGAVSGRDLCYFTFDDETLAQEITRFYEEARRRQLTVGQLWQSMMLYCDLFSTNLSKRRRMDDIFTFIISDTASSSSCTYA